MIQFQVNHHVFSWLSYHSLDNLEDVHLDQLAMDVQLQRFSC